ncbi:MAG: sigma-70 family RNA polymerase sigma factor [Planctomycetota bacterium]
MGDRIEEAGEDVRTASGGLRRLARGLLFDPSSADDAVQDAWVAALRTDPPAAGRRAWLASAARKLSLSRRRDEARRRAREERAARGEAVPSAGDSAARLELTRRVVDAVGELEEPYRSAILLRFFDDLPPREIARRQGVPVNTVRTRVRRGLERLRLTLDPGETGDRAGLLACLAPLAGPSPWPISLGVPAGSWQAAAKWTGGVAMGKVMQVAAVGVLVLVAALAGERLVRDTPEPEGGPASAQAELATEEREPAELVRASAELAPPATRDEAPAPSGRAPAATSGRTWTPRGFAFRGSSTAYPDAPLRVALYEGASAEGEPLRTASLVSASDGSFAWPQDPPDGTVTLRVSGDFEDHLQYPVTELVVAGSAPPQEIELRLYPLDLFLAGRVLDADGQPLAGATVGTYQDREQARTDASGAYRAVSSSAFGSITVFAKAPGFAVAREPLVSSGPGELVVPDIQLLPELRIRGRVVDEAGRPIEGALVTDSPLTGEHAYTDADGRYVLANQDHDDPRLWVIVEAEGFVRHHAMAATDGGDELVYDVVLVRGTAVEGSIVDEDGGALEGVDVTLGHSPDAFPQLSTRTDAAGRFRFQAVGPGEQRLWAERAGFATARVEWELAVATPVHRLEPVVLAPGGVVAGRVVDADGAPLAHVAIAAERGPRFALDFGYAGPRKRTGVDGTFRFDQLPHEPLRLELFADGLVRREIELEGPGDEALRIVLERSGRLAGLVVDGRTGEPLESFRIRFTHPWMYPGEERLYGLSGRWTTTGFGFEQTAGRWSADGEFTVGHVIGIEASAPGYAPTVIDRVFVEPDPELVLRLYPGSRVVGQVLLPDGSGAGDALVRRFARAEQVRMGEYDPNDPFASAPRWEARTDADGWFELDAVPGGEMRLGVQAPGYPLVVDGPFDVLPDGDRVERRIELSAGGVITGSLAAPDGTPLAGETVVLSGLRIETEFEQRLAETDAAGAFRFAALPDGLYQVSHRVAFGASERTFFALARGARVEHGGEVEVDLRPRGSTRVTGTVGGEDVPPADLYVWIMPRAGSEMGLETRIDLSRGGAVTDGAFEVAGLPAGAYMLTVQHWTESGMYAASAEVDLAEGGSADVALELKFVPR